MNVKRIDSSDDNVSKYVFDFKFGDMLLINDGGIWFVRNSSGESMEIGEKEIEEMLFRHMSDNF